MRKRLLALLITVALFFTMQAPVYACNEQQSNTYVSQILFGDDYYSHQSDEKVEMLFSALFICSEQSDGLGQDKLTFLKNHRVSGIPTLSKIDIKSDALQECSHNTWEHIYAANKKAQASRKKVLQNTVNKVFDFGLFSNLFGSSSGKCNSFAALLYYSHILADYLSDDSSETEIVVKGREVPPYSGEGYVVLNGGIPSFSRAQKQSTHSDIYLQELDNLGRSGTAYAVIGRDSMDFVGPRPNKLPDPVGWTQVEYPDIVNGGSLYNRCHLIGRNLCGIDNLYNLITGTRYLNETMEEFEKTVAGAIENTGYHVLYRVTPIFKGDNKIASGVQMEGYSVEDSGKTICFNVYCYNIQPGVNINYQNGDSYQTDTISGSNDALPFAVYNPSDSNPDLIYEMGKYLEILFSDQKTSSDYVGMMNQINMVANEARSVEFGGKSASSNYKSLKEYEYKYFNILKDYVPKLLKNEKLFEM